jgi:hypothetical protein
MKKSHSLKTNRGFTLVEVIISIGFLCIACGIIIQLFIASGDVRTKAALKESASVKASNTIETCRISENPSDIGKGIFDEASTDFRKTDDGYVIRQYFDGEWIPSGSGESIVFIVEAVLTEVDRLPGTQNSFGNFTEDGEILISALYEIHVTAGYVDMGMEDRILADYSTSRHYTFRGDVE